MIQTKVGLADAHELLSLHVSQPTEDSCQDANPLENDAIWSFRSWGHRSRARVDNANDIVSGDPTWAQDSTDDIANHFSEFHSDEYNLKDTALISGTDDIFWALKKTVTTWYHGDYQTRGANAIHLAIIHSADYYRADDLLRVVRQNRLSLRARQRLSERKFLHDSEVLFLHRIPAANIRYRLTCQELFNRGIMINGKEDGTKGVHRQVASRRVGQRALVRW